MAIDYPFPYGFTDFLFEINVPGAYFVAVHFNEELHFQTPNLTDFFKGVKD